MSKQLVMENYVDECLDEVEIRGIFITEGIMDTPIMPILQNLKNKIRWTDNDIRNLTIKRRDSWIDDVTNNNAKIRKYESLIKDLGAKPEVNSKATKSIFNKQIWGRDIWYEKLRTYENKIDSAKEIVKKGEEENLKLLKDIKILKKEKMDLVSLLKHTESNPGMLGNIPYLYQIIGATAIVAAIGYASYKLYKRFISKAAKACQDKKGKTKTICMNQYQIKGLELSKKPFTDGIKNCSKAKDIQICKAKFNKKINAIDKKIKKKQNKIKKLMGR